MTDLEQQIRAWADRTAPAEIDPVTADEALDRSGRSPHRRAGDPALRWRVVAVAAGLALVAGIGVVVARDDADVDVRTGAPTSTSAPDPAETGFTADRAKTWFRALQDVGILVDGDPDLVRARQSSGDLVVYVGTITETPEVLGRKRQLGNGSTPPLADEVPRESYLSTAIRLDGSDRTLPVEFAMGTAGTAEEADAASLAPPVGTRILVIGDDTDTLRVIVGLLTAVETTDGGFVVGSTFETTIDGRTTFDDLVDYLTIQILTVDRRRGTTTDSFVVTGRGCAEGIVTFRIDDVPQPFFQGGDEWSRTFPFPFPAGEHTFAFTCNTQSTAGAPTTMMNPGTVLFTYPLLEVTTTSD